MLWSVNVGSDTFLAGRTDPELEGLFKDEFRILDAQHCKNTRISILKTKNVKVIFISSKSKILLTALFQFRIRIRLLS